MSRYPVSRPERPGISRAMQQMVTAFNDRPKRIDEMTELELDQWRTLSQHRAIRLRLEQERRIDTRADALLVLLVAVLVLGALFPLLWVGVR